MCSPGERGTGERICSQAVARGGGGGRGGGSVELGWGGAGGQWYLISIIVSYKPFPSSFAKFFLRYRLGFLLFLQLLETRCPILFH